MAFGKFWKKKDDEDDFLDMGKDLRPGMPQGAPAQQQNFAQPGAAPDMGLPGAGGYGATSPQPIQSMSAPVQNIGNSMMDNRIQMLGKQVEVVSSKIDSLRAEIEALAQRLESFESIIRTQHNEPKKPEWQY